MGVGLKAIYPVQRGHPKTFGIGGIIEHVADEIFNGSLESHHHLTDMHQVRRALANDVNPKQFQGFKVKQQVETTSGVAAALTPDEFPVGGRSPLVGYLFAGGLFFGRAPYGTLRNG